MAKNITINVGVSSALIATLGLGGYMGSDTIQKAVNCVGDEVQIEYAENYFCGSQADHDSNKKKIKERLRNNETVQGEYGYLQLLSRNDPQFAQEITDIMIAKYNPEKKEFDKVGEDFQNQMLLIGDLADIKCAGECQLTGENMTEKIYNLLSSN